MKKEGKVNNFLHNKKTRFSAGLLTGGNPGNSTYVKNI
jgi:hypothetical protein